MNQYRALLVDDEASIRQMTRRALESKGIACDEAGDGAEAAARLQTDHYDLVVTDLRMPNKHGHALATEILTNSPHPPLIVVLTGVVDARLAEDLLSRGVDDIQFKPVDFRIFAVKVRTMLDRRALDATSERTAPATASVESAIPGARRVSEDDLNLQLSRITTLLPLSAVAMDVVRLTSQDTAQLEELGALIARDASLTVELLKLANSPYYRRSGGGRVDDLKAAVMRIGYRRISELAVAIGMLQTLSSKSLPWIDVKQQWRRSVGTTLALERLRPAAALGGPAEGMYLAGLFEPLGRLIVARAFPREYEQMLAHCETTGAPLCDVEEIVLGTSTSQILSKALAAWDFPEAVCQLVAPLSTRFADLAQLVDPRHSSIELILLAAWIGKLAAGGWQAWDLLDFPSVAECPLIKPEDLGRVVQQTRADLEQLLESVAPANSAEQATTPIGPSPPGVGYCRRTLEPLDALPLVIEQLGFRPATLSIEEAFPAPGVIWNCCGVSPERLPPQVANTPLAESSRIVCFAVDASQFEPYGTVVSLPCSARRFQGELVRSAGAFGPHGDLAASLGSPPATQLSVL